MGRKQDKTITKAQTTEHSALRVGRALPISQATAQGRPAPEIGHAHNNQVSEEALEERSGQLVSSLQNKNAVVT